MRRGTAKKTKMPNETVEGAELIFEIGNKVKNDFSMKQLPLMLGLINSFFDKKTLTINWDDFKK